MQFSNHSRRQGRLHWLAEMYRAYAADLQRFISNKVGDPTVAEDLTSTVFLKALRWLREDQSANSARGWLYATARTTVIDYWQAQSLYEIRSLSGWRSSCSRAMTLQRLRSRSRCACNAFSASCQNEIAPF